MALMTAGSSTVLRRFSSAVSLTWPSGVIGILFVILGQYPQAKWPETRSRRAGRATAQSIRGAKVRLERRHFKLAADQPGQGLHDGPGPRQGRVIGQPRHQRLAPK